MSPVPTTMRAAVLSAPSTITMQERPVPQAGTGDVLVRVGSVGVCGSDVHYYRHGGIGDMVVTGPLVLGHEVGGTVVAVGTGVPESRIGERVALEPQRPCRTCRSCKTGHLNLCPHMEFFATPPIDGAFCDYVTAPADFAHPVPDALSEDAVGLLEPLSVGIWANHKAATASGSRVLITGAGPIGVVAALAARAAGATEVIVSDPVASRRERVRQFGADTVLDPVEGFDAAALGVDAFIECSGATPAVLSGLEALRPGGHAVFVGLGSPTMELPVQEIMNRELTVTGVFRYVDTWPTAIDLVASGRIDLDAMVTARFSLEETEAALTSDDDPLSMKSIVDVAGSAR